MNPGDLRHRITILQKIISKDTEGNIVETWTEFKKVWAAIEPLQGREYYQAAAVNAQNDVKFRIRYCKDLNQNMRIQYEKTYDIQGIIDKNMRHEEMIIVAREVV